MVKTAAERSSRRFKIFPEDAADLQPRVQAAVAYCCSARGQLKSSARLGFGSSA
jgi:hypothetical protein